MEIRKIFFATFIILPMLLLLTRFVNAQTEQRKTAALDKSRILTKAASDSWTFHQKSGEVQGYPCDYYATSYTRAAQFVSFDVTGWDQFECIAGVDNPAERLSSIILTVQVDGVEVKSVQLPAKTPEKLVIQLNAGRAKVLKLSVSRGSRYVVFGQPTLIKK